MKKGLKILVIIITTFITTTYVKADTTYYQLNMRSYNYSNFLETTYNGGNLRDYFISIFNNQSQYNYYIIYIDFDNFNPENPEIFFTMFNNSGNIIPWHLNNNFGYSENPSECQNCGYKYYNGNITNRNEGGFNFTIYTGYYYSLIDTNYDFISYDNYSIGGINETNIEINDRDNIPSLYNIANPSNYTEVNLDNYEYILLSLKDYNQTEAFSTNLQIKGQIGITPIYNYGQTSKDSVTGVQVQDRCNVTYENYTNYPFYILQNDLQNNAIYAVKECSSGSSFKFDNNIFNITYVTQANINNPTVTINGKTYNVIPYSDLPSTATKNEVDNYIPGESGQANSTGGLDSAIKGAQQKMSEIWNTMTYFTSFIGQIFSSLPSELHTILISAFTIMIILGIIKIFLGH